MGANSEVGQGLFSRLLCGESASENKSSKGGMPGLKRSGKFDFKVCTRSGIVSMYLEVYLMVSKYSVPP